jgi:hypothetical protein
MPEKIPQTIINLADKNIRTLEKLKYLSIVTLANYDFTYSQKLGADYMENVLPAEKYKLKINESNSITEIPETKKELINSLISKNIAMILVRPEMFHIHDQFSNFISNLGLKVFYTAERSISFDQYWNLYKGSIRFPDAIPSMPTRTMVYTDSPVMLIAFVDPLKSHSNLASLFETNFKGKEGSYNQHTLRGGVVYPEAKKLGFDTLENQIIENATDPFKGYQHLILSDLHQNNINIKPNEQILRYNAVSVHIPNSEEIPYDLSTLNTENQLIEMNKSLANVL